MRTLPAFASAIGFALLTLWSPASAGAQAPTGPLAIPSPHYVTIVLNIGVNRPAADVWKRVGKYCDIGEWYWMTCTITSGRDGEVGAVRSVANEIMVAKTDLSYTYTQPVRVGQPYNLYHGTVEAKPVTATTSQLIYTLLYDDSMLPDDEARARDKERRTNTFTTALRNMKILAEGGTMPPAPARGGRAGGPPAPAAPAATGK